MLFYTYLMVLMLSLVLIGNVDDKIDSFFFNKKKIYLCLPLQIWREDRLLGIKKIVILRTHKQEEAEQMT